MTIEIALAHAALGRRVFPLAPDTKVPLVKWTKSATATEITIRRWWREWPDAGVAWRLPEGLAVVDVDRPGEVDIKLPPAPEQRTAHGFHRLYTVEDGDSVRQGPIPFGDIKLGGKGYVKLYSADAFAGDPPPLPDMIASLRRGSKDARSEPPQELTTRYDILNYAGRLRRDGAPPDEILAALYAAQASGRLYDSDPDRPWTEDDLEGIAKDIGSKPSEPWPSMPTITRVKRAEAASAEQPGETMLRSIHEVSDEPPKPLLLGRLEPDAHTILFGDGGTGKGVIAAWWAAELTRLGTTVAVLDYEANARFEWKPRLRTFGADLDRVVIAQPEAAIWIVAERLRDEMAELGVGYVVVDSVTYACDQEVEKSSTATKYSAAINKLALPVLSLAHTTKANADPKHPFGSVFWSNGARLTIGVVADGDERIVSTKKVNARAPFPPFAFEWGWTHELGPSEVPATLVERGARTSLADRAVAAVYTLGWKTLREIADAVLVDGGPEFTERGLADAVKGDGRFASDGISGRGKVARFRVGPGIVRTSSNSASEP